MAPYSNAYAVAFAHLVAIYIKAVGAADVVKYDWLAAHRLECADRRIDAAGQQCLCLCKDLSRQSNSHECIVSKAFLRSYTSTSTEKCKTIENFTRWGSVCYPTIS